MFYGKNEVKSLSVSFHFPEQQFGLDLNLIFLTSSADFLVEPSFHSNLVPRVLRKIFVSFCQHYDILSSAIISHFEQFFTAEFFVTSFLCVSLFLVKTPDNTKTFSQKAFLYIFCRCIQSKMGRSLAISDVGQRIFQHFSIVVGVFICEYQLFLKAYCIHQ